LPRQGKGVAEKRRCREIQHKAEKKGLYDLIELWAARPDFERGMRN
jgi:hypothetical protein